MAGAFSQDWSPQVIAACNQAILDLLDSQEENARITIHTEMDVLLGELLLENPCGSVDLVTGVATLVPGPRLEEAPATGVAAYASIRDGAGHPHRSIPCMQGDSPVPGFCILNSLFVVAGSPVQIMSIQLS